MNNILIKIGTRESPLALWQSKQVKQLLQNNAVPSELVLIKSEGDINLTTPLYEMGVQGIFTKTLDAALLNNQIDIAVHSYKDVPTKLANGLVIAAVLKRGNPLDTFVINRERVLSKRELEFVSTTDKILYKNSTLVTKEIMQEVFSEKKLNTNTLPQNVAGLNDTAYIIATSSARRKAQLLNRFPNAVIENLRGNVNTRIKKVNESHWHGAIFAAAGLERLGFGHLETIELKWMLPAPAQGAIVIVCREKDAEILKYCQVLNDLNTQICTQVEKDFLRILMGGCSTPIGAYAVINEQELIFNGNILSIDGKQKIAVEIKGSVNDYKNIGKLAAEDILLKGGKSIVDSFNKNVVDNEE